MELELTGHANSMEKGIQDEEKHDVKVLGWVTGRLEELIPEMGKTGPSTDLCRWQSRDTY